MPGEISATVLAAFGVMLVAEGTEIEVSGVLAVVSLGLSMAAYGKFHVSPPVLHQLYQFWSMLGYMANALIFFLTGLFVVVRCLGPLTDESKGGSPPSRWLLRLLALYVALHAVRAAMFALLWPVLSGRGVAGCCLTANR